MPRVGFFLLYQHVQYTFIMSCWNSCSPFYTPTPGSPFLSCLQVHASHRDTQLLGARNVHLFTDGVHSPLSRHLSIRTCEIIQGLTDSLLASHVACPSSPSTGSYVESRSTPALKVSNPHVSYTTPCGPGSKVLPYGVGAAKA